ncbi:MAG TPA: GPP34 family phosphoprotein [Jiangellaceae bacterium]|nr:GPP34 family phosphoprotein [Jiangellaceae bacterium]
MLIAENLLLLVLDDETGKVVIDTSKLDAALAGSILLELARAERLDVGEPGFWSSTGPIVVADPTPTGDAVLDAALAEAGEKERKPADLISTVQKDLRDTLVERLADRGVLSREEGRVLGIFPTTSWPAEDSSHEDEVRRRLHDVLVGGVTPDERTQALVGLLAALDAAPTALHITDRHTKKAVKKRAEELREASWTDDAIGKALSNVDAAVMAAVIVPAAVSGSS